MSDKEPEGEAQPKSQDVVALSQDVRIKGHVSKQYWASISADVNGMLGGYPQLSKVDLQSSRAFLYKLSIGLRAGHRKVKRTLEGGAGIGRITKGLLINISNTVDIIEPIKKFTDQLSGHAGVGNIFNVGIEGWVPLEGADRILYDLIWIQWCLYFLTDEQVLVFLERCRGSLVVKEEGNENSHAGYLVIKENISSNATDTYDEEDASVTRTDERLRELFEKAGLKVLRTELQRGFPKGLLPVRTYALRPKTTS